jgi:N-acetylneuraminate synthase
MSVEIIAEIGINHNGSLEIAKDLMRMAKECGCDFIKWQKRDIETVYSKAVLDSPRNSPWGTTTREQKQGLEFGMGQYDEIDRYSKEIGLPWFASAWDENSLIFLDYYDCPHQKVASAMATHCDFLKAVADRKKHTFISTGMCTMQDIERTVDIFQRRGCPYTLLHCVASYPCEDRETNLLMIKTLLERFGPPVGYSSHDVGVGPSIIAVVLGATVIEKHITLDRASYGSDQAASMERKGLEYLVKECRAVASCMGDGRKSIKEIEQGVAKKLRYWEESK